MTRCNLAEVLAYIERESVLSTLHLSTVASYAGVSPTYLSRLLSTSTGRTFLEHCRRSRLRQAESYLQSTMLRIKEVANISGYQTVGTMDRDFQRVHGCSPSAWRAAARRIAARAP